MLVIRQRIHIGQYLVRCVRKVTSAEVNEEGELEVEAELDKEHPFSGWLMSQLDKGVPIGLSVRGNPVDSHMEEVDGEMVRVYDRIELRKIGVTNRPSNKGTYLEAMRRSEEEERSKNDIF